MEAPTKEQLAVLATLADPDVVKPVFAWDDTFQRKLLAALLCDRNTLVQSLDKIKPLYFTNDIHRDVCKILFAHFEKYKAPPERWILKTELAAAHEKRDDAFRLHALAELDALYDYYVPGLETREYVLDKVTNFAKVQAVKTAFHNCVQRMNERPEDEGTWPYVYEQMRSAMVIDRNYEPGLQYFQEIDELYRRMRESHSGKDRFTTAFESIDNSLKGGGMFAGQIGAWLGLPGRGKSLMMAKQAVANVLLGHKVLYLTMEMDERGIGERFTSQFTKQDINNLLAVEPEVRRSVEDFVRGRENNNPLIIKQFPGGTLDVNGIRSYHNQLMLRGWKPNLVIIDYVGEMKDDPNLKKYESAYRILRDLRAFGIEEGHCTYTALQPNASAAQLEIGQYIDESNIGTSFDQFKPLDALWSINQHVTEKGAGVGRIFVVKHRDGKSHHAFYISYDYRTLDVTEIGRDRYTGAMNLAVDRTASEVNIDNVPSRPRKRGRLTHPAIDPSEDELSGQ